MKDKALQHHQFYFPPDTLDGDLVGFPPGESRHMVSSLRLRKGARVSATDGLGTVYQVVIEEARRNRVVGRVVGTREAPLARPRVSVFQGAIKPAGMELMVEKCVELGASGVIPVRTERSVGAVGEGRIKRLNRIAVEAMKQSLGAYLPGIQPLKGFDEALSLLSEFDLAVVAWERENRQNLKEIVGSPPPEKVALWVGPEGGFTDAEVDELVRRGAKTFSLGERRLKAETAAIASLAILRALCSP